MAHQVALHNPAMALPMQLILPAIQLYNPIQNSLLPQVIGNTIYSIVGGAIQPNPQLSIGAAVVGLDRQFSLHSAREHVEQKEEPETFLTELWMLFIGVAEQVPHDSPAQDTLAKLVKTLRAHPSRMNVNIGGTRYRVWADLPLLLRRVIMEFQKFPLNDPSNGVRFHNLNAFTARLLGTGTLLVQPLGAWILGGALEANIADEPRAVVALEYLVPIAAEWIQHAGYALYKDPHIYPMRARGARGPGGVTGERRTWRIYDRWRLWRARFAAISKDERLSAGTKALAKEAALDMAVIELQDSYGHPHDLGRGSLPQAGATMRGERSG